MDKRNKSSEEAIVENIISDALDHLETSDVNAISPNELVERYLQLENKTYTQLIDMQELLDNSILEGNAAGMQKCVTGIKELSKVYNEMSKLRQLAEITNGKLLPISVLDEYKQEFYPRIAQGLEEMKSSIESLLPSHMRADFIDCWRKSYYRFVEACKEAERNLDPVISKAKVAALKIWDTRSNERWGSSEHAREKIHNEAADTGNAVNKYRKLNDRLV